MPATMPATSACISVHSSDAAQPTSFAVLIGDV